MGKRKAKTEARSEMAQQWKAEDYYCWLLGKGYAAANAMRMVEAKYGSGAEKGADKPGWAWKG